jgi:Na+-driven multidrug efflux pump
LQLAPPLLVIAGVVQVPFAVSIVLRSALRGAGDVKGAMWITWACTYCVRLPMAYAFSGVEVPLPGGGVLPNPLATPLAALGVPSGLSGLWIGLCAEILVRTALFAWRFRGGVWERTRV